MSDDVDRTTNPSGTEGTTRAPVRATNTNANVNTAANTGGVQGKGNGQAPYNHTIRIRKLNRHVFQLH